MSAGTITYTASTGEHTGSGLALDIFEARKAVLVGLNPALASLEDSTEALRAAVVGCYAEDSQAIADGIAAHAAEGQVIFAARQANDLVLDSIDLTDNPTDLWETLPVGSFTVRCEVYWDDGGASENGIRLDFAAENGLVVDASAIHRTQLTIDLAAGTHETPLYLDNLSDDATVTGAGGNNWRTTIDLSIRVTTAGRLRLRAAEESHGEGESFGQPTTLRKGSTLVATKVASAF